MFGFLFGALCLGGLFALFVHRPHRFRRRGCGSHRLGRSALYGVLERLGTTPGQEKVIVSALHDLKDAASNVRSKLDGSRVELGKAIRAEELDEAALHGLLARHGAELAILSERAVETLATIHEVLDAEQRNRLARLIESGPGWRFAGGW